MSAEVFGRLVTAWESWDVQCAQRTRAKQPSWTSPSVECVERLEDTLRAAAEMAGTTPLALREAITERRRRGDDVPSAVARFAPHIDV